MQPQSLEECAKRFWKLNVSEGLRRDRERWDAGRAEKIPLYFFYSFAGSTTFPP